MNHSAGADFLASILADDADVHSETAPATSLHIEVGRQVLRSLLDKAVTVIPTNDVMPVLKCFQFDVSPQRLRVIATDVQRSMITSTNQVAVSQPGLAVFPAKKLADIVRSTDAHSVVIKVIGPTAHIIIGRASWSLKLQGGDDFPAMPAITEAHFTAVDPGDLADALTSVRYAASRDPARVNLNIVDVVDGKFTACDGNRIQQVRIPDFPVTLRIPISAVDDLVRLLKNTSSDTVHVGQSTNKVIFRLGSDVFIVNKLAAKFPDMEAMMLRPALENKHTLDVPRIELSAALKSVRVNADHDSAAIALHLAPGKLTIAAKDNVGNTATQDIDVTYTGPPRTLVVNHVHLAEMFRAHGDDVCTFRLGDDTKTRRSPVLLRHPHTGSTGVLQQMLVDWATP